MGSHVESHSLDRKILEEPNFYLQRSKKLMNGNLVCFLWPTENDSTNHNNHNNVPNATQYSLFFGKRRESIG